MKNFIKFFFVFSYFFKINSEIIHKFELNNSKYELDRNKVEKTEEYISFNVNILFNNYVIGYIRYLIEDETAYIAQFHFDKDYRRHGLGQYVLEYICRNLAKNVEEIHLFAAPFGLSDGETPEQMLPKLIGFYKKCGFDRTDKNFPNTLYYLKYKNKLLRLILSSNRLHPIEANELIVRAKL